MMMLLATGGFMLMPFGSAYIVNNLGIALTSLPTIYLITGVFTISSGRWSAGGRRMGKYPVFVVGSILSIVMVLIYTHSATGVVDGGDRDQRRAVRWNLLARASRSRRCRFRCPT